MSGRPLWLDAAAAAAKDAPAGFFDRHRPPGRADRASAVLVLVGPDPDGSGEEVVVLTERAGGLRSHAGQIAFPGGRVDPTDQGPVGAALREAREEIGLDPGGVDVVTTLPAVGVPASNSAVTPVLAWWRDPAPVHAASPAEVEQVVAVPVSELRDPANRFTVTHPVGYRGVGFEVAGLFVWGFTAALLDRLLVLAGLETPWDTGVTRILPDRFGMGAPRPVTPVVTRRDDSGRAHP